METIKYLLNWAEIVIITHNGPKLLISLKLYFLDKIIISLLFPDNPTLTLSLYTGLK